MTSPAPSLATNRGDVYSPSACPRATSSSPRRACAKSENLRLDEPALRTTIASATSRPSVRHHALWPCAAASRRACATSAAMPQDASRVDHRVGAAREDDRHPRAEHDARGIRAGEERQALRQHVAGLEIRHDQHVGAAGHGRVDLLDLHRLEADRVVERERPVEDARR